MLATPTSRRPLSGARAGLSVPVLAALSVALLAAGCGGAGGPEPGAEDGAAAPVETIENPALGIGLEGVAAYGFELVANDGDTLRLRRPADGELPAATVEYGAGEPQVAGVNLVQAVNGQKVEIEARPDGKFFGQVQLMTQLGNAYSTRGRYTSEDGQEIEETRIFAVHPAGDRLLWATYRYPPTPGGAKTRSEEAMTAFGLITPLAAGDDGVTGDAAEEGADAAAAGESGDGAGVPSGE